MVLGRRRSVRGSVLAIALVLVASGAAPAPASANLEVALLDPDANLANIARLRAKMTEFLRVIDPDARFRTFTRAQDLARYLRDGSVQFVIVGPGMVGELGDVDLDPLLVPLRNGNPTHSKVLVVRRGTSARDIERVATTSSPASVRTLDVAGLGEDRRLMVVRVSKGIDALLALVFERVDAAHVTPQTLAQLGRLDRDLAANVTVVHRSGPIPNPLLHVVRGNVDADVVARVAAAFATMHSTRGGQAVLGLLDYDRWEELP